MKDKFLGLRLAGAGAFLVLAPSLAWSYIDPGNGAYMVQVLFTLVGAALFYIRHPIRFFHALKNWIFRRNATDSSLLGEPGRLDAGLESASAEKSAGRNE